MLLVKHEKGGEVKEAFRALDKILMKEPRGPVRRAGAKGKSRILTECTFSGRRVESSFAG